MKREINFRNCKNNILLYTRTCPAPGKMLSLCVTRRQCTFYQSHFSLYNNSFNVFVNLMPIYCAFLSSRLFFIWFCYFCFISSQICDSSFIFDITFLYGNMRVTFKVGMWKIKFTAVWKISLKCGVFLRVTDGIVVQSAAAVGTCALHDGVHSKTQRDDG